MFTGGMRKSLGFGVKVRVCWRDEKIQKGKRDGGREIERERERDDIVSRMQVR